MSQIDKLISRFKSMPNDFTYQELSRLLKYFGYIEDAERAGSRVAFIHPDNKDIIRLHKPHPGNIIQRYLMKQIESHLKDNDLI